MRPWSLLLLLPLLPAASLSARTGGAAPPARPFLQVRRGDLSRSFPLEGKIFPAGARPISLWLRAYQGELILTWVLPQGAAVAKGSPLARIDPRGIDREIREGERSRKALDLSLEKALREDRLAREAEERKLQAAARDLERARKALRMWEEVELPLLHREEDLQSQVLADRIQDQRDELEQLEKMYREDELVDETEEIVLKRARRDLSRLLENQALRRARLRHKRDYTEPLERKKRREALLERERNLARLKVQVELARAQRKAEAEKLRARRSDLAAKLEDLAKDRELFDLKSPAAGILLHGAPQDYRPGGTPPRRRRGARLSPRTTLFTVAAPDRALLALKIPESRLSLLKERTAVEVRAAAAPAKVYRGALKVERFPLPGPGSKGSYPALVEIEGKTPGLLPGMAARAKILLPPLKGVLLLPKAALLGPEGHWFCYAEKPGTGKFEKTPVETGPAWGGLVVIRKGPAEGSRVLLGKGE